MQHRRLDPPPGTIAVLRANGLGDLMFSMPALDALRATYPRAEIVLLGRQWHQDLLAGRPGPVDRVVVVPPTLLSGEATEITGDAANGSRELDDGDAGRFFAVMVDERFDLGVQLHGGGRHSNPFLHRLGARTAIGLQSPDAVPLDRCVPYVYYQNEILRLLEVVGLVGAEVVTLEPQLAVLATDRGEADQVLAPGDRPLVVLHPGATDSRRRWPPEHFAAVAELVIDAGAQAAVIGTEDEAELARQIVAAVPGAVPGVVHDLTGRLSVSGLTGLLARSAVVVADDSGPLHLAAAVGAATVGIYWCGNLINAGPMTRSRHRPAISWQLACPECGLDCTRVTCGHRGSFVADVTVDEVATSALELLAAAVEGGQEEESGAAGVSDLVADPLHPAGAGGHVDDQVVSLGRQASP